MTKVGHHTKNLEKFLFLYTFLFMSKLLQFDAMILLKMINKGFIHKDLSRICKFEMQLILKLTSFLKLLFYPKKTHFHYHKLAQPTIIAQIMKKYIFSFLHQISVSKSRFNTVCQRRYVSEFSLVKSESPKMLLNASYGCYLYSSHCQA